jgi:hypothetical protein
MSLRLFIPERYLIPPLKGIFNPRFDDVGIEIPAQELGRRIKAKEIEAHIVSEGGAVIFDNDEIIIQ